MNRPLNTILMIALHKTAIRLISKNPRLYNYAFEPK